MEGNTQSHARNTIRIIVTLFGITAVIAHLVFPAIRIDAITATFLIIAIIPWMDVLFKSVTLPGGISIQFQDLKKAGEAVKESGLVSPSATGKTTLETLPPKIDSDFIEMISAEPGMAIPVFRMELEKRLRKLAKAKLVSTDNMTVGQVIQQLNRKNILTDAEALSLSNLLIFLTKLTKQGNKDPRNDQWVIDNAPAILEGINAKAA